MLFKGKIERAQKWLREQNPDRESHTEEVGEGELPSMEELRREGAEEMNLDKGDLFAMMFAAFVTIIPVCLIVLLLICSVMFLFF